jgi:hypothetical protein
MSGARRVERSYPLPPLSLVFFIALHFLSPPSPTISPGLITLSSLSHRICRVGGSVCVCGSCRACVPHHLSLVISPVSSVSSVSPVSLIKGERGPLFLGLFLGTLSSQLSYFPSGQPHLHCVRFVKNGGLPELGCSSSTGFLSPATKGFFYSSRVFPPPTTTQAGDSDNKM